ncbi:uncharacterized protein LOC129859935 isoform X2 [Salvelinus fontinalis]|uniref:uncharacterized protein LOC129859935 isoform X2 n=1 Tax=Salvelinus fontinalis TaxID=8038 RepID=UPI0024851B00|nr:uncharacterized protein LOC129859935 isoform X2 [Salvelinus fontinalis]
MCAEGPRFAPVSGRGDDVKLYCYIDAVDPDHWLLRKRRRLKGGTYRDLGMSEQKLSYKTKTTSTCRSEVLVAGFCDLVDGTPSLFAGES